MKWKNELELRLWQQKNCKWWPIKDRLNNYKQIKRLQSLQKFEVITYREGSQLSLFNTNEKCTDIISPKQQQ